MNKKRRPPTGTSERHPGSLSAGAKLRETSPSRAQSFGTPASGATPGPPRLVYWGGNVSLVVVVDRQATLPPAAASWQATASPAAPPAPTGNADGLRDGGYGLLRDASGVTIIRKSASAAPAV